MQQCPLCCESIQDNAIVCRFCGAVNTGESWTSATHEPKRRCKGRFTVRTAAAFLFVSGVFELGLLNSAAPLLGSLREGSVAMAYHFFYADFFLALGVGLWATKRWGYWLVFAGTVVYTLEKTIYLLDARTIGAHLNQLLSGHQEVLELISREMILDTMRSATLLFVVGWWGFALYIYFHRALFQHPEVSPGRAV